MKSSKLNDINRLNQLYASYEKMCEKLKDAYLKAEESTKTAITPVKHACDMANARFNLALHAFSDPVKFDRSTGKYFIAKDHKTGKEIFHLEIKKIATATVEISADNENAAIELVENMINNNEIDDQEFHCFVENVSQKA